MATFQEIVDEFFDEHGRVRRALPANKNTIRHDRWDRDDFDTVITDIADLASAQTSLQQITETAPPALADTFWDLVKVTPEMVEAGEVRPSHAINHYVIEQLRDLKEVEKLRFETVNDDVAAAFATVDLEPKLEELFDKLKDEIEKAKNLDDMMSDIAMSGEGEGGGEGEADGDSDAAGDNQELIDAANKMREMAAELDQAMDDRQQEIKQALQDAAKEASKNAQDGSSLGQAWGLDSGGLKRLPAEERIKLSKKLRTDKFRRVAEVFGPLMQLAIAEQERKVRDVPHEIFDVNLGNDLTKMLPTEMLYAEDDDLYLEWMRRYVEGDLMQYHMDGTEKVAKGGIIVCEDGSGSMAGQREVWAKAVGLALLYIASKQHRSFSAIHFGGPAEPTRTFDFDKENCKITYKGDEQNVSKTDGAMAYAETFFNGGTDFVRPLSQAMDRLRDEYDKFGAVKGDIVFITDGDCGVDGKWLESYLEEKEKMGVKTWGILIGTNARVLETLCDRVYYINDLLSGEEMRDIFGAV